MDAAQLTNALVGIVIFGVIGAIVIWIVSKLNLGLWVHGFVAAFIAAVVIFIVEAIIRFLLAAIGVPNLGGIIGFIERLIISAVVLMLSDKLLPGLTVNGFKGAIIASLAISVITWVLGLFLTALGLGPAV